MSRFENRVALVSGGGRGIGLAITEALVAEKCKVVATGRREEPLKALRERFPGQVAYLIADVSEVGSAKRAVGFTVESFGRLDVLVNNAAIGIAKPFVETTDEDIHQLLSINVGGLLSLCREAIPRLSETRGVIVNIGSIASDAPVPGFAAYAGTKAAVDQITRVLAVELGPLGIRVNVVSPGTTETDMLRAAMSDPAVVESMVAQTPLGRLGQPDDIAKAVLFLASAEAEWITGQLLQSSGGLMI